MKALDLDQPLLKFHQNGEDGGISIRDSFTSILIVGGLGSSKTTSSGTSIAYNILKLGYGGLVLTTKPTDKDTWIEFCRVVGREDDLIIIEPGLKPQYTFNFLEYISTNLQGGYSRNIVNALMNVIHSGDDRKTGSDDSFWENSMELLLQRVVELCMLAYGRVTLQGIYDIVSTIPEQNDDIEDSRDGLQSESTSVFQKAFSMAMDNVNHKVDLWQQNLSSAEQQASLNSGNEELYDAVPEARTFHLIHQFFLTNYYKLSSKTRSTIDMIIVGKLLSLLTDPVYTLFCGTKPSTVTPSDCENGKIILLNLPLKIYEKAGRDAQILFKHLFEVGMEKRTITAESIPLFLFIDEAHNFASQYDTSYLTTVRSSCITTVWITQNLPNLHSAYAGVKSADAVKGLLGCFGIKVFHCNSDVDTNRYSSELIGDGLFEEQSNTFSMSREFSSSRSKSYKWDRIVRPEEFTRLKMGGKINNYQAEAYVYSQGNPIFPSQGRNYAKITFRQKFTSQN